jgi:hypothetical protein
MVKPMNLLKFNLKNGARASFLLKAGVVLLSGIITVSVFPASVYAKEKFRKPPELVNYKVWKVDAGNIIKNAPSQKDYPDDPAVILLNRQITILNADGTGSSTIYRIVKILKKAGQALGERKISFREGKSDVEINIARTHTVDGKIVPVKQEDIKVTSPLSGYAMYSDIKAKCISMPQVIEGNVIENMYTTFIKEPEMEQKFFDSFNFQYQIPCLWSEMILIVPENLKINSKFVEKYQFDWAKNIKKEEIPVGKGRKAYIWKVTNLPKFIDEEDSVSEDEIIPYLEISTLDSWDEVSRWYYKICKDAEVPSEEIIKKTEEIIKGKATDEQKIKEIYNWLRKNVRYIAISLGGHGLKPHKAEEIFHNMYGDCKDKAVLMASMLKAAGIESYVTLINTDSLIDTDFPYLYSFDHAILAIPSQKGYKFIDLTAEYTLYEYLPRQDQHRYAFVVKENAGEFILTPDCKIEDNQVSRKATVKLDKQGTLSGSVALEQTGWFESSKRAWFTETDSDRWQEYLQYSLSSDFSGATLKDLNVKNLDNLSEPMKVSYNLNIPNYANKSGNMFIFTPSEFIQKGYSTDMVSKEKRLYDFEFPLPWQTKQEVEYEMPAGCSVEYLPENEVIKTDFGFFKLDCFVKNHRIYYKRIFNISVRRLQKERYSELKAFISNCSIADEKKIVLKIK